MSLKNLFLEFPVCINNYYGDPTLQWENTIKKIKTLRDLNHKGVVSIITRGYINKEKMKELKDSIGNLNFIIIVSVSELPEEIEPLSHKERYYTIENAINEKIKVIPNIRPLIPNINGKPEVLEKIFKNLNKIGINHAIVSGFRGDDHLVNKMNLDKKIEWSLRIKIITKDIANILNQLSDKYSIYLSKRVSCGVAKEFDTYSHNPYYYSPSLVGCYTCSQREKCFKQKGKYPPDEVIEFLKNVGYDFEITNDFYEDCSFTADNRTECPSCCTACYVNKGVKIFIKNKDITLGDTAFIRFLTQGVIATQEGISDLGGDTATAKVLSNFLGRKIHFVNSWTVWSKQLTKCYGCSYCITEAYKIEEKDFGGPPIEIYNDYLKIINKEL